MAFTSLHIAWIWKNHEDMFILKNEALDWPLLKMSINEFNAHICHFYLPFASSSHFFSKASFSAILISRPLGTG